MVQDERVLVVLRARAGLWVDAMSVARALNRNVYDGVVQALRRQVDAGLALQDDDLPWLYCISAAGLAASGPTSPPAPLQAGEGSKTFMADKRDSGG